MPLSERRRAELLAGPYTRLLAEHEGAVEDFYNALANSLKPAETFWRTLAKEEASHKRCIKEIDEKFKNGEWRFKRPLFVTSGIIDSLEWMASRKQYIELQGVSMKEALKWALEVEQNMIESNLFDVVDCDDPKMMDAINTQAAYTKAHIQRLKREARRLKWRIFGRRKVLPTGGPRNLSHDELRNNIKSSQANMLGLLIDMEESASRLYNAYGERIKDSEVFWSRLAAEEMQHASMLRKLYKFLDEDKIFYNVELFSRKALEEFIIFIQNAELDARHGKLSCYKAVCTALKIEISMIESGFYGTVKSDSKEFQIIAKRLVELTREHSSKLQKEMLRVNDMNAAGRENIPIT